MDMNGGSSVSYLACTPCALGSIGVETEGFLDYQGSAGMISIVRWNLRPVMFGVEIRLSMDGRLKYEVHIELPSFSFQHVLGHCQEQKIKTFISATGPPDPGTDFSTPS